MAAEDDPSGKRRAWSREERQRIVDEALAPGVSVAAVARQHGLNANLVFKWIRRAHEGWIDRRRTVAREIVSPAFVPVELLEGELARSPTPPPVEATVGSARGTRRRTGKGAMEIRLPNGTKVALDADVDTEALRRVLSVLSTV